MMARNSDILFMTEYIKDFLYFATARQDKVLKSTSVTHYFNIDSELVYEHYYSDFGPLNLGCVYKYCKMLNEKLKQHINKQTIVHYTSIDPRKKANAAYLLGCYGVLYLSLSPRDAYKPLSMHGATYRPFQDATPGDSTYTITILDCLNAIKKAYSFGFFNFKDFNYEEYERLDKIQGGDLNWIVPDKFLAFIGPVDYSVSLYHPPDMYIDYFLENDVKKVMRLNKRLYDGNVFKNAGIEHYDLFFPDGSCPPRHILLKFLQISEESDCAIAVHCKAGLGRTGSLIGCYLMKHYRMTAYEAIGWMRICRPGSVIGHQQGWLKDLEPWLIKQGNVYRKRNFHDTEKVPVHQYGVYSIAQKGLKLQSVLTCKSPSPPPPIQRHTRSDLSPTARPQASRTKEVLNKADQRDQAWRMKTGSNQKITYKGDANEKASISRRSSAGGEPRPTRASSRCSTAKSQTKTVKSNSNDVSVRNLGAFYPPISLRTPQGPIYKSVNEAKSLMKSSTFNTREKQLNSTITVTPHYTFRLPNYLGEQKTTCNCCALPSSFNTTSHGQSQPQHRRRLGRSPSPPQSRPVVEQTRATNTPSASDKKLARDASKTALKAALSRLKISTNRGSSIGTASVGATSLGARREAPAPMRAPSVRSDERPLATQGDLLNSIKLQRRMRAFDEGKFNASFQEKFAMPRENSCTKSISLNSKTTSGMKSSGVHHDSLMPRERPSPSRGIYSPPRPSSPKGRNRVL